MHQGIPLRHLFILIRGARILGKFRILIISISGNQYMSLGLRISCTAHRSHPSTPRHTRVARSLASSSVARNVPSSPLSQVMSVIVA